MPFPKEGYFRPSDATDEKVTMLACTPSMACPGGADRCVVGEEYVAR